MVTYATVLGATPCPCFRKSGYRSCVPCERQFIRNISTMRYSESHLCCQAIRGPSMVRQTVLFPGDGFGNLGSDIQRQQRGDAADPEHGAPAPVGKNESRGQGSQQISNRISALQDAREHARANVPARAPSPRMRLPRPHSPPIPIPNSIRSTEKHCKIRREAALRNSMVAKNNTFAINGRRQPYRSAIIPKNSAPQRQPHRPFSGLP